MVDQPQDFATPQQTRINPQRSSELMERANSRTAPRATSTSRLSPNRSARKRNRRSRSNAMRDFNPAETSDFQEQESSECDEAGRNGGHKNPGLKIISKQVMQAVEKNVRTTYKQVANIVS